MRFQLPLFPNLIPRLLRLPDPIEQIEVSPESLKALWLQIRAQYFPNRPEIDAYTVVFAPRPQKRVLASCNVRRQRIQVATAFKEPNRLLEALLYHEMCHAVLGEPQRRAKRRVVHGADFRALEQRHPGVAELDRWIRDGGWSAAWRKDRRRYLSGQRAKLKLKRP